MEHKIREEIDKNKNIDNNAVASTSWSRDNRMIKKLEDLLQKHKLKQQICQNVQYLSIQELRSLSLRLDTSLQADFFIKKNGQLKTKIELCDEISVMIEKRYREYAKGTRYNHENVFNLIPFTRFITILPRQYQNWTSNLQFEPE